MESIKTSLNQITDHFNAKMAEFQKELKCAIPATSPTSNLNAQFGSFRSFVLTALENLQLQVELLARQQDELEMRSRRKMLLVHGVAEADKEDTGAAVTKLLSGSLGLPQLTPLSVSRCHRLGRASDSKPRAILIKFRELAVRDSVWSAKTKLKGTGVTVSEFLIKSRHMIFLAARQRFGVTKCWTRDGNILVVAPDGKRHRIFSMSELDAIPIAAQELPRPAVVPATKRPALVPGTEAARDAVLANSRIKRANRK